MDLMKRTLLMGIGAISLSAERAREFVNDLVERGEITKEQGSAMVKELAKRGVETRERLRGIIKAEVKKAIREADIPSVADLKRLEEKIDELIQMQQGKISEKKEISEKAEESPSQ